MQKLMVLKFSLLSSLIFLNLNELSAKTLDIKNRYIIESTIELTPDEMLHEIDKEIPQNKIEVIDVLEEVTSGIIVEANYLDIQKIKTKFKNQVLIERDEIMFGTNSKEKNQLSWALDRIDQQYLPLDKKFQPESKNFGKDVTIYVLDSGMNVAHDEFLNENKNASRAFIGFDYYDQTKVGSFNNDVFDHGTPVGSMAGGINYGIAKNSTLIAVKVLDDKNKTTKSIFLSGLDFVLKHKKTIDKKNKKLAIANMSLLLYEQSEQIKKAIIKLKKNGIISVVAAGNDNINACLASPASVKEAVTVGASDEHDFRSQFTNGGSNHGPCIDLYAPGSRIKGATNKGLDYWGIYNGTSMATPLVSGVLASLISDNLNLTLDEIIHLLNQKTSKGVVKESGSINNNLLNIRN